MGIEAGKKVTAAIDGFLQKAKSLGFEVLTGNDDSRQLLVDRSSHPVFDEETIAGLSPESRILFTAAINYSQGKLRVQGYRRTGLLWQNTKGAAWLELSDPKSRLGLEVVVNDADSSRPDVTTSLPRTFDIKSGDPVVHTATYLMKARSELTQIDDGLKVIALASLALGLKTAEKK